MKRHMYFWMILSFLLISTIGRSEEKEFDIYLCIGQSNMAGRAALTPELSEPISGVWLFNHQDQFEPAQNPLNRYSTIRKDLSMQKLSMAYSFSLEMHQKTGHKIGLVVNARGGSSILSWLKGSKDGYYEEILTRAQKAVKYGRIKGIIWHQGESDASDPDKYKVYLQTLMTDLRKDLGLPILPVVIGQLGMWRSSVKGFNQMLLEIPQFLSYMACASADGLSSLGDVSDPHFNTESQLILGKRYALKMLELQAKQAE